LLRRCWRKPLLSNHPVFNFKGFSWMATAVMTPGALADGLQLDCCRSTLYGFQLDCCIKGKKEARLGHDPLGRSVGYEYLAIVVWKKVVGEDGTCGPSEFEQLVSGLAVISNMHEASPDDVKDLFGRVDIDGDGQVSKHEFLTWLVETVPEDRSIFQECLEARMCVSIALAESICATESEVARLFSGMSHLPLEAGASLQNHAIELEIPDELPDLPLNGKIGLKKSIKADACGVTSMVAWALCPALSIDHRIRVVKHVAGAEDPWAFAALLAIAHLGDHEDANKQDEYTSLKAAALDALPQVVSKSGRLAQEAGIHAAMLGIIEMTAPLSLEFGLAFGFQELRASVKSAAPACLGKILRFYKLPSLSARYPQSLPLDHKLVVEGVLACLPKEALSYTSYKMQLAELVYAAIKEGDKRVARRVLELSAEIPDVVRVHVLSHIVEGLPSFGDARAALVVCLQASGEAARVASVCLSRKVSVADVPCLSALYQDRALEQQDWTHVMEVAAVAAASADHIPGTKSRDMLAEMALLTLREGTISAAVLPALKTLKLLGMPPADGAVAAVLSQLYGSACGLACEALATMVQRGDRKTIQAVADVLIDSKVSAAGIIEISNCLAGLADIGGDPVVADAFLCLLATSKESEECRLAALRGLALAAPAGHAASRAAAVPYLDPDMPLEVLMASAAASKKVCHVGDMVAAGGCLRILASDAAARNPQLAAEVVGVLVEVCSPGDAEIIGALRQQLRSGSWPIRRGALMAIQTLAPASSCSSLAREAVIDCLQDAHPDVRECAVEVLASVCSPGDEVALASLSRLREDDQPIQVDLAIEEAVEALSGDTLAAAPDYSPHSAMPPTIGPNVCDESESVGTFQVVDGCASQCSSFQVVDNVSQQSSPSLVGIDSDVCHPSPTCLVDNVSQHSSPSLVDNVSHLSSPPLVGSSECSYEFIPTPAA